MKVEYEFYIGFRDIDINNNLKLEAVVSYLEDVGGMHSNIAGHGLKDIEKNKCTWILISWKVKMFKKPKYAETVKVETWSKEMGKLYAFRDFRIYDKTGEVIGIATSKWIYVNFETKAIVRIGEEILNSYQCENDSVFDKNDFIKAVEPESYDNVVLYTIQKDMIDINNHVHNLYYLNLAYKALPDNIDSSNFFETDILYKKEIKLGDTIKCMFSAKESTVVIKSEDEKILHAIIKLK